MRTKVAYSAKYFKLTGQGQQTAVQPFERQPEREQGEAPEESQEQ